MCIAIQLILQFGVNRYDQTDRQVKSHSYHKYIYIYIPRNSFGQNFCRRQQIAEFTPETCKNAGIRKKRRRIQKMPDLQMSVEATEMQKIYTLAITPELRGITPELRAITPEL